jgi:hypothetical protein
MTAGDRRPEAQKLRDLTAGDVQHALAVMAQRYSSAAVIIRRKILLWIFRPEGADGIPSMAV